MDCEHRDTKENISSTLKVLKNFHISCDIAYFSILHRATWYQYNWSQLCRFGFAEMLTSCSQI